MAMHKNSVRYRVATAEKTLGRSVRDDRLDLEVALGLAQRLGSVVLG
jgi:DNA-binding PucR family transcriptional regulator